jgi:hypothetical protein
MISFYRTILRPICCFLFLLIPQSSIADSIDIITNAEMVIDLNSESTPLVTVLLQGKPVSLSKEWTVVRLDKNILHFKRSDKSEPDLFLELNLLEKQLFAVLKGSFGQVGGMKVPTMGRIHKVSSGRYYLNLEPVVLVNNIDEERATLKFDNFSLADTHSFNVKRINDHIVQVRHKGWKDFFWEADTKQKQVWASTGVFGSAPFDQNLIPGAIPVNLSDIAYPPTPVASQKAPAGRNPIEDNANGASQTCWPTDLALKTAKERHPSAWQEKQKSLYRKILTSSTHDTLLLPVQVNGYAIDRPGRMLLTYFIHQRINRKSLPNPLLVSRALGDRARTFKRNDIISLANDLRAKEVLVPSLGYDGVGKLTVSMMRLVVDENGKYQDESKDVVSIRKNIEFNDENLPFMVVAPLIEGLLHDVGVASVGESKSDIPRENGTLQLVDSPLELLGQVDLSPVEHIYYLQLWGLLHPRASVAQEALFARSLVAAWELPEDHPERRLLIARALFHLKRRPAALEILGESSTAGEKALLAFLNGNLVDLQKYRAQISSPLKKLMADIEYKDLRWAYSEEILAESEILDIVGPTQGWGFLLNRRLLNNWIWLQQSNILVKNELDEAFPIADFTADSLVTSRIALGESFLNGENIDLSAYEHYRRILESDGFELFAETDITLLKKSDYLDLLYAISETNLVDSAVLSIYMRGLADRGLDKIRSYSSVYNEHPKLTYWKGRALKIKAGNSRKEETKQLTKDANELIDLYSFWTQEQSYELPLEEFKYDFPKRYQWSKTDNYTHALESSLKYSNSSFDIFRKLHERYTYGGEKAKANELLDLLKYRWVGHPKRLEFLAKISENGERYREAENYYRNAIQLMPNEWDLYLNLATLLIRQNRMDEAFSQLLAFPAFNEDNPSEKVDLSSHAEAAGLLFFRMGLTDKAKPFFQISSDLQTGSGYEMMAAANLGFIDGDVDMIAYHCLRLVKRYQDHMGYAGYLRYLFSTEHHQDAWAILENLAPSKFSLQLWQAALFGFRIEGKKKEEIDEWFSKFKSHSDSDYFTLSRLIDRDENELGENYPVQRTRKYFAILHQAFKADKYAKKHPYSKVKIGSNFSAESLPYLAVHFEHFDRLELFIKRLSQFIERRGQGYETELTNGVIAGLKGSPEKAIEGFNAAWRRIHKLENENIPALYQLAEFSEWFYRRTEDKRYLDACMKFATYQNAKDFLCAWPYGLRALYGKDKETRLTNLGIILYLDKNSDLISQIGEEERALGRKAFHLNSFLEQRHRKVLGSEI